MANEYLCDAIQLSSKELPLLEQSCPIGKGLWGKKVPPLSSNFFWIQCGFLSKPMTIAQSKSLYTLITSNVWMKPEPNGYRCLIGPYLDRSQVVVHLKKIQTLPNYQEAFIRVVVNYNTKQASPVNATLTATGEKRYPITKLQQKNTVNMGTGIPEVRFAFDQLMTRNAAITIRLEASLQDKTYVVPYLTENVGQFYMEHNKQWNRRNYEDSSYICRQLGMSLVTNNEFETLKISGLMEKNQWPLQLPYWGKDKIGLFAHQTRNQLSPTSLLNIMCVK